jgi:protocatechuate 3,4-dioxygenase beta subunit
LLGASSQLSALDRKGEIAMQRREVIKAGLGASLAGAFPAAEVWGQAAGSVGACVLTIDGDDGPFYFDPKLVRTDIMEDKRGLPLELTMRIVSAGDCTAIKGARADVWQPDATGIYSGYEKQSGVGLSPPVSTKGQTFLRGTQFTDNDGAATFRTIYPSWYRGRTPHLHFKVYVGERDAVTNQIIFPEEINERVFAQSPYSDHKKVRDTFNADDTYLKRDGSGVMCRIEPSGKGYKASILVGLRKA